MSLPNDAMKGAARRLLRLLGAVVFLILLNGVFLGTAWHFLRSSFVLFDPWEDLAVSYLSRSVPAKFGALSVVAYGDNGSLLAALAFQRKFCGGIAFRITDQVAANIEAQGITWLQSARMGRAPRADGGHARDWDRWQPSPVPSSWIGDGAWAFGLGCLADADRRLDTRVVIDAARGPGAYYTTWGEQSQMLLILPLRLLIFTYEK